MSNSIKIYEQYADEVYKQYWIDVNSKEGLLRDGWNVQGYNRENPNYNAADILITVRGWSDDNEIPFDELKDKDQAVIEKASEALAYVDKTVTDFARQYRDRYVKQVNIQCEVDNCEDDSQVIHFYGTGIMEDGTSETIDDYLNFNMDGWKHGEIPSLTIQRNTK